MDLASHKVNLAKIGTARILFLTAEVLGGRAGVGVALDADPGKEDGFFNEGL
jgi:hypothetical protein